MPKFHKASNGYVQINVQNMPLDAFLSELAKARNERLDVQETLGASLVSWSTGAQHVPWYTVIAKLQNDYGVVLMSAGGGLYRARRRLIDPLEAPGIRLATSKGFYYGIVRSAPLSTVVERWNELTNRKVQAHADAVGLSVPELNATAATPEELLAAIAKSANVEAKLEGGIWKLAPKPAVAASPPKEDEEATWTLKFVGENTDSTKSRSKVYLGNSKDEGPKNLETGDDTTTMSTAVRIARFLYASSNGALTVGADRNLITLKGPKDLVQKARTTLAQSIDIPYSQVQVDAWTVQINTTTQSGAGSPQRRKERAQENLEDIRAGLTIVRDLTLRLNGALGDYVRSRKSQIDLVLNKEGQDPFDRSSKLPRLPLGKILTGAGFNTDPLRPLTTAESMVFLALRLGTYGDTHDELGAALRNAGTSYLSQVERDLAALGAANAAGDENVRRRIVRLRRLVDSIESRLNASGHGAFPHFLPAFADSSAYVIQQGVKNFFFYWLACNDPKPGPNGDDYRPYYSPTADLPVLLAQSAAGADAMLKEAMGGFTTDVQSVTTKPLLAWIRNAVQEGDARKSGIDLVGDTSLGVSSRLRATVKGSSTASYPFMTRPKLTLDDLKTSSKDASLTDTVLQGLSPAQLQIALAAFREPSVLYDNAVPGIELTVRPQVLRDGGSARLEITLKSSMEVNPPEAGGTDPLDHVKSHEMTTDVAVQALDLLEVSTFGLEHTGLGDPTWRIPVLEQIPILGSMFRGPRARLTKHQESMVILSVTVLPKSLDLAGGYIR